MKLLKNIIKTSLVFGLLTTSFSDLNAGWFSNIFHRNSRNHEQKQITEIELTQLPKAYNCEDSTKSLENLEKVDNQFAQQANQHNNVNDILTKMKNVQNQVSKIYNKVMNNKNNKNICDVNTLDFVTRIASLMNNCVAMDHQGKDYTYMQNIYNNVIQMCNSINDNFMEISMDEIDQDRANNQLLNEQIQEMIGYTQNDDHEMEHISSTSSDDERYYAKLPNFEQNAIDNVKLFYGQNITPNAILEFLNEYDNEDAHKYTLDEVNQMIEGIKSVDEEIKKELILELGQELGL